MSAVTEPRQFTIPKIRQTGILIGLLIAAIIVSILLGILSINDLAI